MPDPSTSRPVRRVGWLLAGVLVGVVVGFAFGLARPRPRPGDAGPAGGAR